MESFSWKDKLLDSVVDRNVLYTVIFLCAIMFTVPPDRRDVALAALATLAFAGGTAKTVMNGIKAKAAIVAATQGGGTVGSEGQGQG